MRGIYRYGLLALTLAFNISRAFTQNIPDSLLLLLTSPPNDSARARALLTIKETIEATDTEKSFGYYQQALNVGKK
jgi:hypothetical protein